jgi:predicted DNA binding CopG/RHH family protein
MIEYIDEEEKELIESLHSDHWISDFDETIKKMYEESAKLNRPNAKKISINLSERDYHKIQAKALEQGIPYQSMISMLIHKFNEGKIAFTA